MHVRGRQIPRPEQMAFENAARGTNGFFPEYFALESICGQAPVPDSQVSRLHRSLTPQVNCCSGVAAVVSAAQKPEQFQKEQAPKNTPIGFN